MVDAEFVDVDQQEGCSLVMLRIGGSIRVIFDAMEPGGDESGSRVCGSPTVMVVGTLGNASYDGLRQILDEHKV